MYHLLIKLEVLLSPVMVAKCLQRFLTLYLLTVKLRGNLLRDISFQSEKDLFPWEPPASLVTGCRPHRSIYRDWQSIQVTAEFLGIQRLWWLSSSDRGLRTCSSRKSMLANYFYGIVQKTVSPPFFLCLLKPNIFGLQVETSSASHGWNRAWEKALVTFW